MLYAQAFGNIILIFSFIFCISYSRKPYISFFFILLSVVYLIYLFYTNDFRFDVISHFSDKNISLIYKILAFYSSNEGSMLLWILAMSLYSVIFCVLQKACNSNVKIVTLNIHGIITAIFIAFEFFMLNPFKINFVASDVGMGFNPLLHDSSYITHPPFMYLGYLSTSILYSISLSLLICKDFSQKWLCILKLYGAISCFFLTLGIFLGSLWAYKELGWGGFWFWDPVENVALIPWLLSIINLHLIHISIHKKIFKKILIFNYISLFCLIILGTFITRSGIVESVHSFVFNYSIAVYLLLILSIITIFAFCIFFFFQKNLLSENFYFFQLDKNTQITLFGLFVILISFFIVLLGVLSPILFKFIFSSDIIITEDYYNSLFNYCALIVLLCNFIALYSREVKKRITNKYLLLFSILISLFCIIYLYYVYHLKILSLVFFYVGFLSLFYSILVFVSKYLDKSINFKFFASFLSHLGFSILFLGICFVSNMKVEKIFEIKKGESYVYNNKTIVLENYKIDTKNLSYDSITANLLVYNEDKSLIDILKPEYRLYKNPLIEKRKVYIRKSLLYDIYVNILDITKDENRHTFHFNLLFFPFVNMIWCGGLLILLGIFTTFFYKDK